jgi:Tat protein secretion system quality control protein TatD with DNase activity
MIKDNKSKFTKGCVLNFQGTKEFANKLVDLDLYFGLTAYSVKKN